MAAQRNVALPAAKAIFILAILTAVAAALGLNAASAGFVLLVGVLFIASREPLVIATLSAVAATLSYNFFFFPPRWTFRVDDPANWIALAAFLVTSLIANRLLVRERAHAEASSGARRELEALYDMSVDLLKSSAGIADAGKSAIRCIERSGAASGGVILFGSSPQHQEVLAWTGEPISDEVEDVAAGAGRHGRVTEIPSRFGTDIYAPLMVGGRATGTLVLRGRSITRSVIESAATLLSFAIERERFISERAHVEALRASNELNSSLLQAVSHDLKSPLTVLTMESDALARKGLSHTDAPGHVRTLQNEIGRLHRRINNLLSIARYEAGTLSPRSEPTPAADLFRAARESLPTVTAERSVRTTVGADTPDLLIDPSLALEIVVNLMENAHRCSPVGQPLELAALTSTEHTGRVWIEVRDRGNGLPETETKAIRNAAQTDATGRGIGIELARKLASLSGGTVEWFERPGGGTIARVDVPAAAPPQEAQ